MRLEPLPSLTDNPVDAFDTEQLIQILGCSRSTAARYQAGTQTPRPAELAHLRALAERRIMPSSWPKSMYFRGDKLHTPLDREPLTHAQIQQSQWVARQWYGTMDFMAKAEKGLREISPQLTFAELTKVRPIHAEMQKELEKENPLSHQVRKRRQWFRHDGC
ncbi:hypothetical protein HBA55_34460 [Pseudomaricurvus alkylphenolicus]|uniref:hypothetical protein n=1 Tax=Pseudomaricurvus alkylphenolicus TaxID=1306991 RepID=UPI00141F8293|nr:hypothetical protein [Pseudomaricurvus alkylphenolicus]NIB44734.1 hypothetical protein [Pseudomaricurvus alkylphenolicus]